MQNETTMEELAEAEGPMTMDMMHAETEPHTSGGEMNTTATKTGSGSRSRSSLRSPRFTQWLLYFVFAVITMVSTLEVVDYQSQLGETMKSQKWALACSIITSVVTFLIVTLQLNSVTSTLVVGTKIEGFVILILVAFWSATVAVVSDPHNGLAVNSDNAVVFGNLYYFSWAGFVTSITLTGSYLRSAFHVDVAGTVRTRSARLNQWSALLAFSLVVMGTGANIFDADCRMDGRDGRWCRRTALAVSLGCVGTVVSLLVVGLKVATATAPFVLEVFSSFVLFVAWGVGVAYITSEYGPGAALGNMYYFSWMTFLCTFLLGSSCYEDYQAAKAAVESQLREEEDEQMSEF